MFARKRPLTCPHDHDPAHDHDLAVPLSRHPRRSSFEYFRRQSWLNKLLLRFKASKGDPLAWLIFFFVATFLMAGATLIDRDVFRGARTGRTAVGLASDKGVVAENRWKSWSPFTSPLGNTSEANPNSTIHASQSIHPKLRPASASLISRDRHGLRVIPLDQETKLREHPIATLIREAGKKADQLDAKIRSIRTFEDAEADYRTAFGMEPPRGFRRW